MISKVGPSSSTRMVSLVFRSTMLAMAPLCFAPIKAFIADFYAVFVVECTADLLKAPLIVAK